MGSLMRAVLIVLVLSGCATASISQGFYGTWHGPRTIAFQGSEYEMNGTTGHYASDARTLYFTEHSGTRISRQPVTLACPYALLGNMFLLTIGSFTPATDYRMSAAVIFEATCLQLA
jgi:hypothetical protein